VSSPTSYTFDRQQIVVSEEDAATSAMIIATLRQDGHSVTADDDALSATAVLAGCDLLISSLRVGGVPRVDLLDNLRACWPALPILFLAREGQLPVSLPCLCVPSSIAQLQAAVLPLLPQLRAGTVLAVRSPPPAGGTDTTGFREPMLRLQEQPDA
jgi:CheY-like chemotaxis protein